jgi:MFS transporter, DHA3 family, macrolide efflux protein
MQRPQGMAAFYLVAFGQFISLVGTSMSQFGLTIWAWRFVTEIQPVDNPATAMALIGIFQVVPTLLLSTVAGALVDRWNRKLTMMLSDLGAGVATISIFLLFSSGQLQIWHLYLAAAFTSAFTVFQWPAYSAAISIMVPREQYTRSSAVLSLTESIAGIFAPVLAALLLTLFGLSTILSLDIISFLVAIGTLLIVQVPPPPKPDQPLTLRNLWSDSLFGFRYIFARPSLLAMQLLFLFGNFLSNIAFTLQNPMILSRSGNDQTTLALVQAAFGVGSIVGGVILATRGGFKRLVDGVVAGWVLSNLGIFLYAVSAGLPGWMFFSYLFGGFFPLPNSSNQALWQSVVPPEFQGRVFSARRLIAWVVSPLGIALAGPLADQVFEPGMQPGGGLSTIFGGIFGTGPGAGMALLIALVSLLSIVGMLLMYRLPVLRQAQERLQSTRVQDDAVPDAAPAPS